MIDDDGSGTTGTIINNAWKQELYNQIDALAGGGDFTAEDLTVTGALAVAGASTLGAVTAPSYHEAGRAVALGHIVAVPYAAGNFTASTGAWTVEAADQIVYRYARVGKLVFVTFNLMNTSVSVATTYLQILLPIAGPPAGISNARGMLVYRDAGGTQEQVGAVLAQAGNQNLFLEKQGLVQWAVAANNTSVTGSIWYESTT
jgi:hypothetical protein